MKTNSNRRPGPSSRLLPATLAAAALWTFTGHAGASIGVNFGTDAYGTLASTDVAGAAPYAQVNYNDVTAAATGLVLNDNTGAATTATLTTTGANSFTAITTTVAGTDEILNNARFNASATTWSFTLGAIPYSNYSIVVYDMEFAAGAELGIGVGGTTYYTSSPTYNAAGYIDGNAATPYIYTQGVSTISTAPTPLSDYVVFTGLTGSAQTVTMTGFAGGGERIGGFQIVPAAVPEPATWAMLALGGLGLLGGARRWRCA